jgi:acyl carrier protein
MNEELNVLIDYIRNELGYDGPLEPDTDLLKEQILDSFSIVQMVVQMQEEFEVEFEPEELVRENLSSLSKMMTLIQKHRD